MADGRQGTHHWVWDSDTTIDDKTRRSQGSEMALRNRKTDEMTDRIEHSERMVVTRRRRDTVQETEEELERRGVLVNGIGGTFYVWSGRTEHKSETQKESFKGGVLGDSDRKYEQNLEARMEGCSGVDHERRGLHAHAYGKRTTCERAKQCDRRDTKHIDDLARNVRDDGERVNGQGWTRATEETGAAANRTVSLIQPQLQFALTRRSEA